MDAAQSAQLELIVRKVISGEVLQNWNVYALFLAIVLVGGAAVSFITAYLQGRAKTYATKADFQELLDQLKQNTEATEKIKAEVSHEDWKLREMRVLRRTKLEELVYAVHASAHWLDKRRQWWFKDNDVSDTEQDPSFKVTALAALYFPELKTVQPFDVARINFNSMIVNCKQKLNTARLKATEIGDNSVLDAAWKEVREQYEGAYPKLLISINFLSAECASLMAKELV